MTDQHRPRVAPLVEELDARILFSAEAELLAPGLGALLGGNASQAAAATAAAQVQAVQATGAQVAQPRVELVFVDMSVPEAAELVSMLDAQADGERSFEIVEIDPGQDGLEQITNALAGRQDIAAIHIVSHGDAGGLQIGSTRLDAKTLAERAGEVVGWSDALDADADLMLYGCDLASGAAGVTLIDDLATLTGADVAASTDRTGSALLGADWVLEYRRGSIEAAVAADAATQAAWQGTLATATFQEGVSGYTGTQDTHLSKANSTTSYGSNASLIVDDGSPNDENVLIRFDNIFGNGAGQIPLGSTITSATLTIYVTNHDAADTVEIYRMLASWSESSTYSSMSGGVSPDGSEASSSVLYSLDAGGSGSQVFTGLASALQAWSDGAANYGFLIGTGTSSADNYTFVSSEGATAAQRPLLTVTYTAPAAPVLDLDANNSSGATGTGYNASWTENGGAVAVADSDASLTDSDSSNLTGLTVTITNATDGTAEILAATTTGTSISASYDSSTQVLTLSGTDTVAHYQQVLRTVTYNNTSENPSGTSRSISYVATDAYATSSTATATVAINAVNDAPVITSNGGGASASISIAENTSTVTTVTATDAEGATLTYSISGGADAAKFSINSSTGALTFASAPDFDNPTDSGGNNVYDVIVQVSDGSLTDTQAIAVTVTAVNDNAPVITSNGGGATASVNVAENTTAVTTVTATDADLPAQTLTYSITGGADQALFTINASTGALAFVSGRDRENATDANADGIYQVTVQVSDGSLTDTQAISVTVTAVNDNTPVITSNGGGATASVNVAENATAVTTVTATDADLPAQTLTYSIVGGADQALFTINASTGALAFVSGRDRENPTDADADGVYEVTVQVSDGSLTDTQAISVTVTAVNDNTPVITSNGGGASASINVAENATAVTTVTATDADLPAQTLTYSIVGGADQALFTINASTGALAFVSGRDRENATDADADGVYEVTVQVSDGSLTDTQAISVTVTAVNDNAPVITSNGGGATASVNVAENATAVTTVTATDADLPAQTLTYSIVGGADQALFTINASTGALSFVSGRDRESATDANADGVYEVTVQVSDGSLTDTQAISVTVTAVNDNAPVITSNGGGTTASVSVAENTTTVTTVTATDADLPVQTLTYSITGGADQALFTINASTGALSFVSGRDRENATDADADGIYEVTVQVSDGSLTDTQAISVTVTAVNDNAPVITSNGGGATASVSVAENATAVTTVTATDADLPAQTLTYSIVGGADQALFTINASTGALSFVSGRDRENATDADADGVYEVTVQVNDGGLTDTQAISVTVTAVNDNTPVITSNGGGATASVNVVENATAVTTVTATDADLPAQTLTYSIVGGADQALFTINASTGALSFVSGRDRENATDADADGIYEVTVQVSDGSLTDTQAISVTVTAVNDNAPVITSNGGGATASVNVAENTTAVTTVVATDADLPAQTLTYSIVGGADQALFTINASTGALAFVSGRDRESPTDADADGVYEVTVQVSDGSLTDTQAISVTVTAVNDNTPVITSNGGGATASMNVAENATAVTTVTATDADLPAQTLTYSIVGGADQALFTINASTGALAFVSGRDRENATDADADGIYEVTVQVSDGSLTDTQAISVTVTAVNDNAPVITSNGGGATASVNVAENATTVTTVTATDADLPAQTMTYSIVGGADQALFTINASTGALAFVSGRDRENPTDADADGVYEVTVQVSDGSLTDTQSISVTVTAVNDNTPVITSNGGGATASINVAENATAVTTVTATDADLPAQTLTYSIVGGADQALFTINASTGALSFVSGRDGENPTDADADGVYEVTVQVSDGSLTDTQAISVTVTAVNDNTPVITSNGGGATASINVAENATAVTTVTATDADLPAQALTYSIVGGADQALFTINASTGALSFVSGRDHESPTDADADGIYEVIVQVSDGSLTDTQAISVTVTAVNDNTPVITSDGGGATASINVAENATAVTTVAATDADLPAQTLTYSIVGGADQSLFTINASTGALAFASGRDRENATDADADGVYEVTVQVSDGSLTDTQAISVTVTAVNDNAPVITSNGGGATASVNVAENATTVTTVTATDADLPAQTLTYSIVGGADQALFTINASTGALAFVSGRDRESATDADADGIYEVTVQVSDGSLTDTQAISVTVTAVNDNSPVITSNGGGATASVNVAENATTVTTVTATDADLPAQTLTYSIVGGADQALFTINASTGALSFVSGRDRENPTDADADGVYEVTVQVSDGSLTDTQAISVTVTAVNDNTPVITSNGGGATASINVAENTTAVTTVTATDADLPAQTLTYSIVGGADQALFTINASTGALAFVSGRDRENATDADADGVYDVTVQVSDGSLTDTQAISVTVTAVNDNTPVITSNGGGATASMNVAENATAVTTVTATDADLPAQTLTYSIAGGADQALFTINASTGALSFVSGRDRENPTDADADGVYEVTVQVSDGSLTDTQAISVTVTAVNDNTPVITSDGGGATASVNVAENATTVTTVTATDADLPAQTLTYSIVGGADQALFTINASTGALSFVSGRDRENPTDADADGVYEVTVQVSDGSLTDTQAISVTVTAVNDNTPVITSNGGGATASINVAENATAVTTVTATDADLPAQTLTYSIVGGADQALFTINASTGALSFVSGRDRESPTDADADGVYEVTVQVSDGSLTDTQAISVTVTAVNDNTPVITSNGGGASATITLAQNTAAVTTVVATDADLPAQALTYSIVGGADQALFTIDAGTGALSFLSAPSYASPADAGGDNVYDVVVQASDGSLADTQAIAVTIVPTNDYAPVFTSNGGGATASVNVAENATAVTTVTATDADLPAQTLTYSIVGGADQALFTINASTGALSFVSGRDHENTTDADADGVYEVTVQVSDGSLVDTQAISVTVTAVNDNAPAITSNGGGATASVSVAENTTSVTTVAATDADLPAQTLTYSILGGADQALFTINASTGALSFVSGRDHENATDADADGVYEVTVQVSDGSLTDTQSISVTVTAVNDNTPVITSNGGGATASINVAENATAVTTVTATDADLPAQTLTYSIVGGADQALFTINASTGALAFVSGRDRENATDADADGVYEVTVQVSDGSLTDTQAISVTVTAVNDNTPVITSNGGGATASVNVAENATAVTTVTATDADLPAQTLTYSIVGGADQALFTINASTGALAFVSGRDRENPTDADADGVYEVTVQVSDGSLTDTQAISVTVTAVNDNAPVITSNGGGATASVNVAENATAVTTVTAIDADLPAQTLTYSIVGGADQALFTINASTGALAFVSGRDRENATDADADGVYEVTVQVSDGSLTDTQAISVTVTAVNDNSPVITSNGGGATASVNVAENATTVTTVTATDADLPAQTLTYSIVGGADQALFTINSSTGALAFVSGRDFESATDADADGVYEVTVQVSDGSLTDTQAISVTVTAVNDNTPVITSNGGGATASVNVAENATTVTTVMATDADLPAQTLTYSIVGGADQALFTINASTGALSFVSGRDRENATDADADGVYEVTVQVSDGSLTDAQAISVTVTAVNDNSPVITSNGGGATASVSVAENATAVTTVTATDADLPAQTLTYSIVGGADQALFTINASTGALSFVSGRDRENATDADTDGVYEVTVQVSDGSLVDTQAISVTVTAVNDNAPAITSNGGGATVSVSVAENATAVTTVTATDADLPAQTLTYSIVGGADQALFTINASTGALAFVSGRDRENATDANADGVYDVTVQVSDGSLTDTQAISVTVTAVNDNTPVITSNGGGATASINVAENVTAVTTVTATDADLPAQTLTYSIGGGADQALFTINASTGALSFVSGRDRESATDANADGVYEVTVQVSDGSLTDTQAISVTVTAVNDNTPVITSNGGGATASVSVAENTTAVTTVAASDADSPAQALTYSISGGADAARFTIDANTGALSFIAAPDFENPADSGADNVYDVIVRASDGSLGSTQALSVTVGNANEAPSWNGSPLAYTLAAGQALGLDAASGLLVQAADPDGDALQAVLVSGAAHGQLTLNADGSLGYQPDAGYSGSDSFSFRVSDGSLGSAVHTVSLTVQAAAQPAEPPPPPEVVPQPQPSPPAVELPAQPSTGGTGTGSSPSTGAGTGTGTGTEQPQAVSHPPAASGSNTDGEEDGISLGAPTRPRSDLLAGPGGWRATSAGATPEPAAPPSAALAYARAYWADPEHGMEQDQPVSVVTQLQQLIGGVTVGRALPSGSQDLQLSPVETSLSEWQFEPSSGGGSFEIQAVQASGIALSTGVVWWAMRVSGLLLALSSSAPAWRALDPLPVVDRKAEGEDDEGPAPGTDEDELEHQAAELFDRGQVYAAAADAAQWEIR